MPISLVNAIGIVEKAGKGRATNANRKDGLDYTGSTVTVMYADLRDSQNPAEQEAGPRLTNTPGVSTIQPTMTIS